MGQGHGGIRSANVKVRKSIGAHSDGETAVREHGATDVRRHEGAVMRGTWVRQHGGTGARRYEDTAAAMSLSRFFPKISLFEKKPGFVQKSGF